MVQKIIGAQRDFSAGEIDTTLKRNDDHPARKAGVRQAANWRILNGGAVQNRSGRRALFPETGRTEKITISPGVVYFLTFGNGSIHIRDGTGALVASQTGYAWTLSTVSQIVYALVPAASTILDVVITFTSGRPQVARFTTGTGWSFFQFAFTTGGFNAPQEPFFRLTFPGSVMLVQGAAHVPPTSGDTVTLQCSQNYFVGGMVGTTLRVQQKQIKITAFIDQQHASGVVVETLPGTELTIVTTLAGYMVIGDIVSDTLGVQAELAGVGGGGQFFFNYLKAGTRFSTPTAVLVGPNGTANVTVSGFVAPLATAIWDEEVMNDFRGWPASCFYDQGRLGFANIPSLPRAIAWSEIGIYGNFLIGANPTDGFMELVPIGSRVLFVMGGQEGNEFVFCDNAIYYIPISVTNPLKPGSVAFNLLSDDGCSQVQPRATQDVIIYVNAGGNSMRAVIATGAYQRPFNTDGLNEFCSHLINNVVAIAAPRGDTTFQERYVYVLNADGSLAVGKYSVDVGQIRGIVGWVPFSGAGTLSWVSALNSDVFFSTSYAPNGISPVGVVEILDDTQYLDCAIPVQNVPAPFVTVGKGPLFAFANGSVTLIDQVTRIMGTYLIDANGNIIPQNIGGENLSAASLVAGQPWTAIFEPFVPDAQPGADAGQRMFKRRVARFAVHVIHSTGFLMARLFSGPLTRTSPALGTVMNQRRITAWNQDDDPTLPPPQREEAQRWRPLGRAFDPRIAVIKDTPGPMQIAEIGVEATI